MRISVIIFLALYCSTLFTSTQSKKWQLGKWKKLLYKYGYTKKDKPKPEELKEAIVKLRILYKFDDETTDEDILEFLDKPRCGNTDVNDHNNNQRSRRYDLNPAWGKKSFEYKIETYSSDMTQQQQDSIAAQAFQLWKNAVPELQFTPTQNSNDADIIISFVKGGHPGCTQQFDGAGSILGHAYLPEDGRIHLDDDEDFTDQSDEGTNLYALLAHEIGHVLGLGHSFEDNAVMYAVHPGYNPPLTLHQDDINGIRTLYDPSTTPDPNCIDQEPSLCALYKNEGYCAPEYTDVMSVTCPRTCNLCA